MTSAKATLVNGPWLGGYNVKDDPQFVQDTELTELINFNITDQGLLEPRTAFTLLDVFGEPLSDLNTRLVGSVLRETNPTTQDCVFKAATGTQFYVTDDGEIFDLTTFTGLTATGGYYEILRYAGLDYYVNTTGAQTFRVTGGAISGAATLIPNWPNNAGGIAGKAFLFKDRMWVVANNRIYYSKSTDPTIWAAPDGGFFDVAPGDGDNIQSISVQNDNIFIFKSKSVWQFQFTSDPTSDGYLRIVVQGKGAESTTVYQNEIYTVDRTSVYIFSNGNFIDIGRALDLLKQGSYYYRMIVWESKLVVWGTDLWVMNLNNRGWTKYKWEAGPSGTDVSTGINFGYAIDICSNNSDRLIIDTENGIYMMRSTNDWDAFIPDRIRTVRAIPAVGQEYLVKYVRPARFFKTKAFTFEDEFNWKRLFSLRAQGSNPITEGILPNPFDTYESHGNWFLIDYIMGRPDNPEYAPTGNPISDTYVKWLYGTSLTTQDLGKISAGSFRFKKMILGWRSKSVVYASQFVDGVSVTTKCPTFEKIQMIVGQKTLVDSK